MAQLCTTFCDPTDGSLPGSSVHGIFQARIQKWVVMSFFRGIFDLGSNPVLLNCRQTLYPLSHQGYQNLFRMMRVIHRISGTKFQKVGVKKKKGVAWVDSGLQSFSMALCTVLYGTLSCWRSEAHRGACA